MNIEPIKAIAAIEFTTELVREYSMTPSVENLGGHACTMELYTGDHTDNKPDRNGSGTIEWVVGEDAEEVVHIGVWWENRRLTDYDGVFSLNPYAIKLLRKAGITVGRDFTD